MYKREGTTGQVTKGWSLAAKTSKTAVTSSTLYANLNKFSKLNFLLALKPGL